MRIISKVGLACAAERSPLPDVAAPKGYRVAQQRVPVERDIVVGVDHVGHKVRLVRLALERPQIGAALVPVHAMPPDANDKRPPLHGPGGPLVRVCVGRTNPRRAVSFDARARATMLMTRLPDGGAHSQRPSR